MKGLTDEFNLSEKGEVRSNLLIETLLYITFTLSNRVLRMENVIALNESDLVNTQKVNGYINLDNESEECNRTYAFSGILYTDENCNMFRYVKNIVVAADPKIITPRAEYHYSYDAGRIRCLKAIHTLKDLNQIEELKSFLQTMSNLQSQNSTFVHCIADNRNLNVFESTGNSSFGIMRPDVDEPEENGIINDIPYINMTCSFIYPKNYKYMSAIKDSVIPVEYVFNIVGMIEIKINLSF